MRSKVFFAVHLGFVILILLAATRAWPTDYVVDRLTDSISGGCTANPNDCSLRVAVQLANDNPGDDIIHLAAGTYELSLPGAFDDGGRTGDLDVTDTVRIEGLGAEKTIIDAAGIDRVFDVDVVGGRLTLRGVTVTGGVTPTSHPGSETDGGGFRVKIGDLRLESCVVAGNTAGVGIGGAIISTTAGEIVDIVDTWVTGNNSTGATLHVPRLVLERSTVSANVSTSNAPAMMIYESSVLANSTVSGHTTPSFSGGVAVWGGETTIASCTLADNDGSELHLGDNATVELSNTVIAGNCSGMVDPGSVGGNLESPGATCGLGPWDIDYVADPGLSALGFHGGVAPVFLPLAGSAAVDAAIAGPECVAFDQRGLSRPRDGDGDGAPACDIGAVELAGPGEVLVESFESGFLTPWSQVITE